jgi:hypothetical protein
MFCHASGLQVFTVSCSLPTASSSTTTAGKRRCRRRRRRRHTATIASAGTDRSPTTATVAADTPAGESASTPSPASPTPTPPSPQQPVLPASSPEIRTPPPKRNKRKRRNEVELSRGLDGDGELLLSPLSCTASSLQSSLSPPSNTDMSPTVTSPPLPPAPLVIEPATPPTSPPAPPELVTLPPPAVAPPAGAVLGALLPPSPSPSPLPSPSPEPPAPESSTLQLQPPPPDAAPSEPPHCEAELSTIPIAPPFSAHLPLSPYHVICCLCFRNSHSIAYKQYPNCYKLNGGNNYLGW